MQIIDAKFQRKPERTNFEFTAIPDAQIKTHAKIVVYTWVKWVWVLGEISLNENNALKLNLFLSENIFVFEFISNLIIIDKIKNPYIHGHL